MKYSQLFPYVHDFHFTIQAFRALGMSNDRVVSITSSILSGESMASQIQMFVSAARYEGSLVAVKPVRKQAIKQDRELLMEMQKVYNFQLLSVFIKVSNCNNNLQQTKGLFKRIVRVF